MSLNNEVDIADLVTVAREGLFLHNDPQRLAAQ